jgi:ankyrin repeat protein
VSLGAEVGYKLEEQPNLGWFPLLVASCKGQEKVVRALLKAGAKPNQRGGQYSWSALFVAAQNNFPRIACILLAGGADINLANYEGSSPLFIACQENKLDVVKLLVRARGKFDSKLVQRLATKAPTKQQHIRINFVSM